MDKKAFEAWLAARWPGGDVCTTAELSRAGIGDRQLAEAVREGLLVRLRRGAYTVASVWRTLAPWDRTPRRLEAHARTAPGAVYSHTSAAHLHGGALWNVGEAVHITTAYSVGRRNHAADTVAHCHQLAEADLTEVRVPWGGRVMATSIPRTASDCARTLATVPATVIVDSLLRRGLTLEALASAIASSPTTRGIARARTVLELADGRAESPGETRLRILMAELGIPEPVLQLRFVTAAGVHRVDFAWPEAKLIVEFDGDGKYTDYGPTGQAILAERRRETALMELGWRFIRIRWSDLDRPEEIRQRILAKLEGHDVPDRRKAA